MAVNVVWFKRDLRFADHAPLELALKLGEPTLMIYLIEPKLLRNPHYRGRHWQFIGQSLEDLQRTAETLGHRIEVLEGDAVDVFNAVHRKLGITRLLSYEETGLDLTFQRDQAIAKFCQSAGIEWREFQTNGVERGRRDRKGWNRSWHRFMTADPHQIELGSMKSTRAKGLAFSTSSNVAMALVREMKPLKNTTPAYCPCSTATESLLGPSQDLCS